MKKAAMRTERVLRGIVLVVLGAVLLYLAVISIVQTCNIVDTESTEYHWDNPLYHVVFLALALTAIALLGHRLNTLPPRRLAVCLVVFVLVAGNIGIVLTRIMPGADQGQLMENATRYVLGDHAADVVLQHYPHQIGVWLYFILCAWVTGSGADLLVQVLNTVALAGCYCCAGLIAARLFKSRRATNLTLLLCLGFLPLALYVTFVYGTILGVLFALLAVLFQMRCLSGGRWRDGLLSVFWIFLAINMRNANLIVAAAMILCYLVHVIKARKIPPLAAAVLCLLVALLNGRAMSALYGVMTNSQPPLGVPLTTWVDMGLTEDEYAPGWWGAKHAARLGPPFKNTPESKREVDRLAREDISGALSRFVQDPAYAASFFYRKTASMWNNPTFQSFWIGTHRASKIEDSPVASFFYNEERLGNAVLRNYMNLFQTLVLVCAIAWLWLGRKTIQFGQLCLCICFIGFFLFHLVWEAKAQYAVGYFFLLLPCAAAGLSALAGRWAALGRRGMQWWRSRAERV